MELKNRNISPANSEEIFDFKKEPIVAVNEVGLSERAYERVHQSDDLKDLDTDQFEFLYNKMQSLSFDDARAILRHAAEYFDGDLNFPSTSMNKIQMMLKGPDACGLSEEDYSIDFRLEAALIKFYSPYPEVRAVCSPVDDPTVEVETLRAYIIGGFWVAGVGFLNQIFSFRQPSFSLNSQVVQILVYPTGLLFARILPKKTIGIGKWKVNLNPGPWTFKEQMLTTIMTNVGAQTSNLGWYLPTMVLPLFFNEQWIGNGFIILMSFCLQFFGMGLAGVLRRWVIYPVKAVWPTELPVLQLNRTLLTPEKNVSIHGWTISKYKLFFLALCISFSLYFIPDYLFKALSTFNWMTWIAPQNKKLAFVTGSTIGLGVNPVSSFDWAVINYATPLILPFFVTMNQYVGTILAAIVIAAIYFSNYMYTGYMPPNTANVYDRFGDEYNLTRVVDSGGKLNITQYESYSSPYISAGNLVYMCAAYMNYTLTFCYIFLSEWKTIKESVVEFVRALKNRSTSSYEQYDDAISTMMRKYNEVPDWWFLVVMLFAIVCGIVSITVYPSDVPVWVIIVMAIICVALMIPGMVLYSTTGKMLSLNMLGPVLGGYMAPGHNVANILCRIFGYSVDEQGQTYIGDQKIAHYAKLPPRSVFRAQIYATIIQVFVTTGALDFLLYNVENFCSYEQASKFTCPFAHTLYSDTLLFSVIGPTRTFDQLYPAIKYMFLVGAVMSVVFWYLRKTYPNIFYTFHPILVLGGFLRYGSTYNLTYYTPGFYMAFVFNYYIRRRYLDWWSKYNYILQSAITAGVAFCGILIFFALQYHPKSLIWWGNTVSSAGIDGKGTAALVDIPSEGYFGVPNGTWH
ncbi:OPT oligopeptide transporter protein-domain-containing protein [Dipodascopsis uninucleata]